MESYKWADDDADAGVCPRCNSSRVTVEPYKLPPRSCGDCGDEWAGLYREQKVGA